MRLRTNRCTPKSNLSRAAQAAAHGTLTTAWQLVGLFLPTTTTTLYNYCLLWFLTACDLCSVREGQPSAHDRAEFTVHVIPHPSQGHLVATLCNTCRDRTSYPMGLRVVRIQEATIDTGMSLRHLLVAVGVLANHCGLRAPPVASEDRHSVFSAPYCTARSSRPSKPEPKKVAAVQLLPANKLVAAKLGTISSTTATNLRCTSSCAVRIHRADYCTSVRPPFPPNLSCTSSPPSHRSCRPPGVPSGPVANLFFCGSKPS